MYEPADGALSWGSRISQLAEQHPDKIAMILAFREEGDRPVAWTEIDVTSNRAAHLLKNRRVGEHSMVSSVFPTVSSMCWLRSGCGSWVDACCR